VIQDHSDHSASKEPVNPFYSDSSVSLMHHDPGDLGSPILIQIIPNERTDQQICNSLSLLKGSLSDCVSWNIYVNVVFCFVNLIMEKAEPVNQ